jgi:capsid assembly protease
MDELKYSHIVSAAMEDPWAIWSILPIKATHAARTAASRSVGDICVLPLMGTIVPRADVFSFFGGGTSVQGFTGAFRAAMADPTIGTIVIDIDSPGGQVGGVDELAKEIQAARGQKPIVAIANNMAASAAYWIACAANEVVVTPSGEVGSIGVFAMHHDMSQMLDREGVKVSMIAAGKYKTEGNPFEPLSDEARTAIQGRIDSYYNMFVSTVAKSRGASPADVRDGFGQGRVVGAREAVASGMADRVATLDETIERLRGRRRSGRSTAAELDFRRRRLRAATQGSVETE